MSRLLIFILLCISVVLPISSKNVYIALNGNDNNEGSVEKPFKTIKRALKEIYSASDSLYIYLRKGVYEQEKTLEIIGLKNVILTAYRNETVSITGGKTLDNDKIEKVKDLTLLSRFNKKVRNKIRYIDLESLNVNATGLSKRGFAYKTQPSWNEIFIDGEPLHLSRWPNDSMILTDSVINIGNVPSKGISGQGNPIITFIEEEPLKWKTVKGAWICGYFGEGWADDMLPLDSINKTNKTLIIGSSSHYGFKADGVYRRWFIRNLPEEIDIPGEYIIDDNSLRIYFLPYTSKMKNIQISILKEPIISINSCHNILINNIVVESSRGIGIQIDNSSNVRIDSCTLRNIGNLGIKFSNSTSNSGIQNSYIYKTGAGGVDLNGGNRKQLKDGNNYVKNCQIYDFNRIEKSYRPAIHLKGCGNKVSNVEIFDAPSMAIYMYGNNHTIEYVDVHHVCKEVYDQGAIYYGRNPTERGHTIRYSYLHDIQSPFLLTGIYHDDGACGMKVYGCIFYNISSAPVLIGGGHDITYTNNIFMNLPYAIQIDNRLQIWQSYSKWLQPNGEYDIKFKEVDYTQPPYSEAYPELLEYWETQPAVPKRNVIKNNIFYNVKNIVKGKTEFLKCDNNLITNQNPGFVDIMNPMKGFDAVLLKKNMSTFIEIPVYKIGCNLRPLHKLSEK